jgi:hypothetical protein
MPEWWFVAAALVALSLLGLSWPPLLWAGPFALLAVALPLGQAALAAARAQFPLPARSAGERVQRWALVFFMHLQQALARLIGRLKHGLSPWRRRGAAAGSDTAPAQLWSEGWRAPEAWLAALEDALRRRGALVQRGGDSNDWDFHIRGGLLGGVRTRLAVEEHGAGRQLLRLHAAERSSVLTRACIWGAAALALVAASAGAMVAAAALAAAAAGLALRTHRDHAHARAAWAAACREVGSAAGTVDPAAPAPAPDASMAAGCRCDEIVGTCRTVAAPPAALVVVARAGGRGRPAGHSDCPAHAAVAEGGDRPRDRRRRRCRVGPMPCCPATLQGTPGGALIAGRGAGGGIALVTQVQRNGVWMLQSWTGERVVLDFRAQLFRQVQRLSLTYHDTRGTSDSLYRIQYDAAPFSGSRSTASRRC